MSSALIAVVVALLLSHRLPQPGALRNFAWFDRWRDGWDARLGAPAAESTAGVLLLLLPVFVLGVLQALLVNRLFGLFEFLLCVLVLFACWGPRDLDRDVEAVLDADDADSRLRAAEPLFPTGARSIEAPALVDAVFSEALNRWFGVLLWFVLLGPAGALLFRLTQLIIRHYTPAPVSSLAALKIVLEWPTAQLMTLALALAASFDAVHSAWREWHQERGEGWFASDIGFLFAAGRASVVFELTEDARQTALAEIEAASEVQVDLEPTSTVPALRDAMSLVWRMLIVWLTVLAVIVLAGFVG